MTVTIGRCSLTQDPYNLACSGDDVGFMIDIVPSVANDVDEMKARRQQLLGLIGNADEEVFPFTWSEDSTFDGFYRVRSVTVPSTDVMLSTGSILGCEIVMERVGGYASPWFEVIVLSVVRTEDYGITTPQGVIGWYYDTTDRAVDTTTLGTYGPLTIREADFSAATNMVIYAEAPHALSSYRFALDADEFYFGACTLEAKFGSTWYPMVGRHIPDVTGTEWRISNGIVRLTAGASTSTFEVHNGTAWESQNVGLYQAGSIRSFGRVGAGALRQPEVLQNSPVGLVLRTSGEFVQITYTLRPGARHVEITIVDNNDIATPSDWGVGFTAVNACTSITGGIRRTSNDANGNRMVFIGPSGVVKDVVNGEIHVASPATAEVMQFGVGVEYAGSTATTDNTAAMIVENFVAAASFSQRVVPR